MKGLLIKDLKLMAGQKQYFISMILIAALLLFSGQRIAFVLTYLTILCVFFTVSTVSYDEYNNGYAFLFTLPVSRRGYVVEKYLFGLLTGGFGWAVAMAMALVYTAGVPGAKMEGWLEGALAGPMTAGLMLALMLPVQLKFGADKSRMVSLIFMVAFLGLTTLAAKVVVPRLDLSRLSAVGADVWIALACVAYVVLIAVSVLVSIRVVEKKQF